MHKNIGTVTFQYNKNKEIIYSFFNPFIASKKQNCKLKGNDEEFLKEEAKKLVASWFLEAEKVSEQDLFEYKLEFEEISKEYFVTEPTLIKRIVYQVNQVKL